MNETEGRAPSVVRKSIEPLAEWYRANKPDVKRLVISQDDYDRLMGASKSTLTRNSFTLLNGELRWKDFQVVRK